MDRLCPLNVSSNVASSADSFYKFTLSRLQINTNAACSGSLSGLADSSIACKNPLSWFSLWNTEKIVPVGLPQIKGYAVYVLLYHIAAKAVIVNMDSSCLNCESAKPGLCCFIMVALIASTRVFALFTCFTATPLT